MSDNNNLQRNGLLSFDKRGWHWGKDVDPRLFNLMENDGGVLVQATFSPTCPGLRGAPVIDIQINVKLILQHFNQKPSIEWPV